MTEPTAAPWRTPQGLLIKNDVVYSNNTAFGDGDIRISLATSCELELWQICEAQREKIRRLLEAAERINCGCSLTEIKNGHVMGCGMPELCAAIADAEKL